MIVVGNTVSYKKFNNLLNGSTNKLVKDARGNSSSSGQRGAVAASRDNSLNSKEKALAKNNVPQQAIKGSPKSSKTQVRKENTPGKAITKQQIQDQEVNINQVTKDIGSNNIRIVTSIANSGSSATLVSSSSDKKESKKNTFLVKEEVKLNSSKKLRSNFNNLNEIPTTVKHNLENNNPLMHSSDPSIKYGVLGNYFV